MSKTELTKDEAYAVAEFIDTNIFPARIREKNQLCAH